jgi:hypothetical protein
MMGREAARRDSALVTRTNVLGAAGLLDSASGRHNARAVPSPSSPPPGTSTSAAPLSDAEATDTLVDAEPTDTLGPAWQAALEQLIHHVRHERARRPHTVEAYRRDAIDLARTLASWRIDHPADVDLRALRRYLADLGERGYARSTVARRASTARIWFALLEDAGVVASDPAALLASPKQGRHLPPGLLDRFSRVPARGVRARWVGCPVVWRHRADNALVDGS